MLAFFRNIPAIVLVLLGLVLIYCLGAMSALGNPWFVWGVAGACVAVCAGLFGPYSNGSVLAGNGWWRNYGIVITTAVVYMSLLYVPLAFPWVWTKLDDPIFWLGAPLVVAIIIMLMPNQLPPAALLPWGFLIGTGALLCRWGFYIIDLGRKDQSLVFTSSVATWIANLVFSLGSVGWGAVVTIYIVAVLLLARFMYQHKILLWPAIANAAAVFHAKVGQLVFIGDASAIHVHHHTDPDLAERARREFNFHPIHNVQLWGHEAPPPFDTLQWSEDDWRRWYADNDPHRLTDRLTTLAERLDVTAFLTPGRMVMPLAFFPGFPGFVELYDHMEAGLQPPPHGGHQIGEEYIDLRKDPPREVITAQIVLEHGFEATITMSYRRRPVWLDLAVECKGREQLIADNMRYAAGQIAQAVGPWLYGFLGNPLSDPARGGVQRGLVVSGPARDATPFTRGTSMVRPGAVGLNNLPQLDPANREAFEIVRAILVAITIKNLCDTGFHVFEIQIDDVNVPANVRKTLDAAVGAVIANSVLPETANLERAMMEAKVSGIYEALSRRAGATGLSSDQITEILVAAVKLMHFGGGTADLLAMAMANTATRP